MKIAYTEDEESNKYFLVPEEVFEEYLGAYKGLQHISKYLDSLEEYIGEGWVEAAYAWLTCIGLLDEYKPKNDPELSIFEKRLENAHKQYDKIQDLIDRRVDK